MFFKINESKARRTLGDPNFANFSKTIECDFKLNGIFMLFLTVQKTSSDVAFAGNPPT